MKITLLIITLIFLILVLINILGFIYPKIIPIKYFKKKERDFFILPVLFIFIIFSFYLEYYNKYLTNYIDKITREEPQIKKSNLTNNEYLTSIDNFKERYNYLSKTKNIFDINKDLINEVDGSKSIFGNSNFKINFVVNSENKISKINVFANYKNDIENRVKYINSISAFIYSIDSNLDYDNSWKLYQNLIKYSLSNKQSNIHFGKYKTESILYSITHIQNEYFYLEIESQLEI